MKVLQINGTVNVGSTGRIAEQIGKSILQDNGESIIAFGRYENISQSTTIRIGNKLGLAQHLLLTRIFDKHGLGSRSGTKAFIEQVKLLNPDVIHLHQMHGYYLNIEVLFSFLSEYKKPVIWTLHDCWSYTGHCCYYARVECVKWKTGCYDCPLTRYYPQSLFFDNSKENYAIKEKLFNAIEDLTLVPVSDWLADEVSKSFLKRHSIYPIYNGIDVNKFQYSDPIHLIEKHNLKGKNILLGVASLWSDLKGLKDFIAISKIADKNIRIILIGLSEDQIKNLPPNIIGIAKLDDPKDLASYYSLADVFVNPSIAESFGLVTVEAMACGTPVVGYDVTAMPELIKSGTGYVVEKSNVKELLNKINLIIDKGKDQYSILCRNNVIENYNQENQYIKYVELYRKKLTGQMR